MKRDVPLAKDPTRNVWLQLGHPNAEEHFLKAQLVARLNGTIERLKLTRQEAAHRVGATYPELSNVLRGNFAEVSLDRLMRYLSSLGHHIEIKISRLCKGRKGHVTITSPT
jgi:predicted XRE-type DNA-binding protein